ncbi:MAG: bifunctional 4-hydroxy-2-oxoglutarate aldolase/2-dehydro-3-deoxy-phosphogluconate aldolase, partial [Chitinophagaceae bacterium]|nr:bifunctional 4-hydroxy-2-oxoglutarate aldolase/2-dehydro-3-deoxy-phosphogluconate aldolase [Chitinophagaceae bacterium]
MENKQAIINVIKDQSLVPLFYYKDKETSLSIVKALYESGIRLIEWTNRGDNALDIFNYLKEKTVASMPELYLGAG